MKSVKHLWASLLIVMAFVIICPTALAATGNSSQIHSKNPVDAYPNSTVGVIHFYIDDGKLIVYDPDERTSVRGDTGTATIYWTIPGQVFWSISSNISGPMVFSGSVSTTAGDYCPLNGISFDGYVSGLVDVQMMPGSNYATLEGSMLLLPIRSVAEHSETFRSCCFGAGNSANAGAPGNSGAASAMDSTSRSQR